MIFDYWLAGIVTVGATGVDPASISLGVLVAAGAHGLARLAWVAVSRGWQRRITDVAERIAEGIAAIRAATAGSEAQTSAADAPSPDPRAPGATPDTAPPADADLLRRKWSTGR